MNSTTRMSRCANGVFHREAGMTLVELMVAMVLGLLISAAAVAALIIGRQGFASVDSSTQLRENARFEAAFEMGMDFCLRQGSQSVDMRSLRVGH